MKPNLKIICDDVADSNLPPTSKAFIFLKLEAFEKELRERMNRKGFYTDGRRIAKIHIQEVIGE